MTISNTIYRGVAGNTKGAITKSSVDISSDLGPKEVLIKITHSSLCYTDIHMMEFGCALGHEGVGIVEKVGSEVTTLKVGDRAGGGYLRDSCGHCNYCTKGRDIYCYERHIYGENDFDAGTFAEYYIGKESYIHKIPSNLPSEYAAPLQCAGSTVYNAITSSAKPGNRVGILGIGGLGHLAIQFSAKLGFDTVVFSTTRDKEDEARGFGAEEFYLLSELEKVEKPVDVLIVTAGRYPDWTKFMNKNVIARGGNIVALSAPIAPIELPSFPFFFETYNFKSSLVASRGTHADMLAFAARMDIRPVIEKFEFSQKGFEEAMEKMKNGKMRYRGVLVADGN
ncbi:hypothetical protein VTL71DRAFT_9348 [Oculimacula yallundae]|uniref:Enoyl reductase (ER) domain-containing protein n=1 Tax=Oculimacula yallundae TaxID=86028 RepID=A0ABR4BTL2_9HELO